MLKVNGTLTSLDMSSNGIASDGVWAIAQAMLNGNCSLLNAHLLCNPGETDETNMKIISDALEANLEARYLSVVCCCFCVCVCVCVCTTPALRASKQSHSLPPTDHVCCCCNV